LKIVSVRFALEPVFNAIDTLDSLATIKVFPKLGDWITNTIRLMPSELERTHRLLFNLLHILYHRGTPVITAATFPEYIDNVEATAPIAFRDMLIEHMLDECKTIVVQRSLSLIAPTTEQVLTNIDTYLYWLSVVWPNHIFDGSLNIEAHKLLTEPERLHRLFVDHMRFMWNAYLREDWERNLPFLEQCVAYHQQLDFSGLNILQAINKLTGQDMQQIQDKGFENATDVIFIPNMYVGPYLGRLGNRELLRVMFQAQLPASQSNDIAYTK
jgi:hypothetical protein